MPKLIVAGCSFSDRTKVKRCYGDYLADELEYNYMHLARGASSNERSWLKLSRAIIDGDITTGDIVILQYTDMFRRLLPSIPPYREYELDPSKLISSHGTKPGGIELHITKFGKAYTTDFKSSSYEWQNEEENKTLHKNIESYAINIPYDIENFALRHRMFESLCIEFNIKLVVLVNRYVVASNEGSASQNSAAVDITTFFTDKVRNRAFHERDVMKQGTSARPHPHDLGFDADDPSIYDNSHLSILGHRFLADCLKQHVIGHKLVDKL